MTLWQLNKKQKATISSISDKLEQAIVARLDEMGIAKGQTVTCLRKAPLNGPTMVQIGGSAFALEQDVASAVIVNLES